MKVTMATLDDWVSRTVSESSARTTGIRPSGASHSRMSPARRSAVRGVNTDGLTIMVHPTARAGATLCATVSSGQL